MKPALSVILAASGGYSAVRSTVQRVKRQACAQQIELIVVGFGGDVRVADEDARHFWGCQEIALERPVSVAVANAEGVRRAKADIVVFGEDHCFPDPGWAEALIEAHRAPHAVVGPVFRNANPGSVVSWCDFLIAYGTWMEPSAAELRPFLPGHNSSYKRVELLAYGERLAEVLESETVLHFELCAKGKTLYLEPKARVAHMNFAMLPVWTKVQFFQGWVFGGSRGAQWPLAKRLLYAAASPMIPVVRFARIVKQLLAPGRPAALLFRITPGLVFGLSVDGLGQMLGYLFGPGQSAEVLSGYEYNRIRFVSLREREESAVPDG